MTTSEAPDGTAFRRPATPPTTAMVNDRDQFDALSNGSLATTQAAAEKWRAGLAAFVTLVGGGLLIKGPEAAQDLTSGWRVWLTITAGGGLVAAVIGLWLALQAAAGTPRRLDYPDILTRYGGIQRYQVVLATNSARCLGKARFVMGISLVLLVTAVLTSWWAPKPQAQPAAYVKIETRRSPVCGELLSADRHRFRIAVDGVSKPRTVPFNDTRNLRVVASC